MWKADETYKETKYGEVEDKDSIRTALLSASTALMLMAACLKRAVVLFLVEQWRVWVFLVLNLIVVAIFFTSNPSSYGKSQESSVRRNQMKIEKRECREAEKVEIKEQQMDEKEEEEEESEEEEEEEDVGLSKEELNERVEAFIVMFKQHLISDARKGGNRYNRTPLSYDTR